MRGLPKCERDAEGVPEETRNCQQPRIVIRRHSIVACLFRAFPEQKWWELTSRQDKIAAGPEALSKPECKRDPTRSTLFMRRWLGGLLRARSIHTSWHHAMRSSSHLGSAARAQQSKQTPTVVKERVSGLACLAGQPQADGHEDLYIHRGCC